VSRESKHRKVNITDYNSFFTLQIITHITYTIFIPINITLFTTINITINTTINRAMLRRTYYYNNYNVFVIKIVVQKL
jgi:hypothetical protein